MAISETMYPVKGTLYDLGLTPSTYTSGGTSLGEALSVKAVAFQHEVELLRKQSRAGLNDAARVMGSNVTLEVILANRSSAVLGLMFQRRTSGSTYYGGFTTYKPGSVINKNSTYLRCLQIRPDDATHPSLCIPRAICVAAAPVTFDRAVNLHDGTVLTLVGLYNATFADVVAYGDMASFPSLA